MPEIKPRMVTAEGDLFTHSRSYDLPAVYSYASVEKSGAGVYMYGSVGDVGNVVKSNVIYICTGTIDYSSPRKHCDEEYYNLPDADNKPQLELTSFERDDLNCVLSQNEVPSALLEKLPNYGESSRVELIEKFLFLNDDEDVSRDLLRIPMEEESTDGSRTVISGKEGECFKEEVSMMLTMT
ncbi:hypothetical protein FGB62_256g00 [Gracilaria domingensis]|nr:hypothetical protein FGB62_256g00 [Gracilaria domingensis]